MTSSSELRGCLTVERLQRRLDAPEELELVELGVEITGQTAVSARGVRVICEVWAWDHQGWEVELTPQERQRAEERLLEGMGAQV